MNTRSISGPFEQLRELLDEVKDSTGSVSTGLLTAADPLPELYARLDAWIAAAEQRKFRNESIISSVPDAVIALDDELRIRDWNLEAERMFGHAAGDVCEREFLSLILPPRLRTEAQCELQSLFDRGAGAIVNRRLSLWGLRRDGSEFPIEVTLLAPVEVEHRLHVHLFVRDLSERHVAEARLQASEALYHSLVERLPLYVIRKDVDGRLTFVNDLYCQLYRCTRDDVLGKTDRDLLSPEQADKYMADDRRVMETGETYHAIERNVYLGQTRHFETYKVPVQDGAGQTVGVQAVFWEMTERVHTREALARERDLLRTLMDHVPDLIYVKDQDRRYVTMNRALLETSGSLRLQDVIGKTVDDLFPGPIAQQFDEQDEEVLRSGQPVLDRESHLVDAHGEEQWYLCSKVPLENREGTITGIVGIDRNITQRRRAEIELRRSNRELDQFVSVVTHDLQAPLRAVASYWRLFQKEVQDRVNDESRGYIDEAMAGLKRMQALIDSLRNYARVTSRPRPHKLVDLNVAFQQAVANLQLEIQDRTASVERTVLPAVPGDPTQLMQLFQNLIANALKYCRDRTPRVRVDVEWCDPMWQVSVTDNGIGIEPGRSQDIFRIFERLHESETEFSGMGIGLAVCQRIVDRHGGEIWVDPAPSGQGSAFRFTLRALADAPGMARPLGE